MKTRRHGSVTAFVSLFQGTTTLKHSPPCVCGKSKMRYEEYLKTNRWKKRRKKVKKLYRRCMYCGSKENLEVHHRHLSTVGRENIYTDLSLFCKICITKFGIRKMSQCMVSVSNQKRQAQYDLRKRVKEIRMIKSQR